MALEEAGAAEEARAVPAVEMAVREARADEAVRRCGGAEVRRCGGAEVRRCGGGERTE